CSSSLSALSIAARSLSLGKIDAAIVGGASYFSLDSLVLFSKAQSMSGTASRPFDSQADGLICGEGHVFFVIKTLQKALEAGDQIRAVIRGIGVSSDGKGKSLWAPQKEGQMEAIRRAYRSGADPLNLQFIEGHMTSTPLGDPTEITAINEFLREVLPPDRKVLIGGVKANVGHTLEAAGLVGLAKAVLVLKHKIAPGQINIEKLNEHIDWDHAAVKVPMEPTPLSSHQADSPIQVSVNSFGIGGLNVHVVLEEMDLFHNLLRQQTGNHPALSGTPPKEGNHPLAPSKETTPTLPKETTPNPSKGDHPYPSKGGELFPHSPPLEGAGGGFVGVRNKSTADGRRQQKTPLPIAVIGIGCLFPGAKGADAYWNLLQSGSDPKTECPDAWDRVFFKPDEENPRERFLGGYITDWEYDWKKHKIPPKQIVQANPLQFMILDTVDQAFEHAGYKSKEFDRQRTSVVVGTTFDRDDFSMTLRMVLRLPEIIDAVKKTLKAEGMDDHELEKTVDDFHELIFERYPALLDETGSFTPSTLASRITKAFDLKGGAITIDSGNVSSMAALNTAIDMIRTGESSMVVCASAQRATCLAHHLLLKNKCRSTNNLDPLDTQADGFYPGEGVGVVILKSLEQAKADGDRIFAVIHDISCSAGQDQVDASEQSMRTSLQRSGISGEDIALLETSCDIAPDNRDRAVASWEQALTGKDGNTSREHALGSVFGQIGHLWGASGMASLIKAILALQHQESPQIFGTNEIPKSKFCRTTKKLEPYNDDGRLFSIVLSSDAVDQHYGISYSVLLERGTRVEQAVSRPKIHIMPTITPSMTPPRLRAFMFSGQGSQYKGMLHPLADASEDCREIIAGFDAKLRQLGYPTLAEVAWNESVDLGRDPFPTQLSLLISDTVFSELLKRFGCTADLVLGHSYGEYPALVAAGVWDFATAAAVTHARCGAINRVSAGTTGMLSTDAPIDWLQEVFQTVSSGRLYVSNCNSQKQVVVSGDNDALRDLDLILKREKYLSLILPVPAGFHSPLVDAVREPLKKALEHLPLWFPSQAFLSSVSGRFEAEPESIRENLVEQMVRPVDYIAMLQKAYKYGVRQFIEVGPKTVLTNLAKTIFAEQDDVEILHCDLVKKTGQEAWEHFQTVCQNIKQNHNQDSNQSRNRNPRNHPLPPPKEGNKEVPLLWRGKGWSPLKGNKESSPPLEGCRAAAGWFPPLEGCPTGRGGSSFASVNGYGTDLLEGLTFTEVSGTPYQIGYENGQRFQREIRGILHRYADAAGRNRLPLPDVSSVLDDAERFFDNDTLQELKGLAEGAGVPLRPLLRHNLSAYPPTSAGTEVARSGQACVFFAGNLKSGEFIHGANVDVPLYRMLPGAHLEILQVRRPDGKIPHLLASGVGFMGGVFGINASGLCVTTASLSEFPWDYTKTSGILPLHLLGRILAEANSIKETVELLKTVRRMGAWSFGISELSTGKIAHIEYDNDSIAIQENVPYVIAANHQLSGNFQIEGTVPKHPVHSASRYGRLQSLLKPMDGSFDCSKNAAFDALRDKTDPVLGRIPRHRTLNTLWRIDNVISLLVDASEGVLRLATTDITRTDASDNPSRHLTLPLVQLLPELERVLSAKTEPRKNKDEKNVPKTAKLSAVISRDEYIRRNTSKEGKNPNP
ncbi:MAG: C45 family autoproteolytic acyltransferase/hydrolase, partial [Planctomycetaceae bacterium]|nr:C45 family autoproteolytic acyltransferase/hydrolase [Planctomycetaceae bacterium]